MGLIHDALGAGRSLLLVAAPVEARAVARALRASAPDTWWRPTAVRDDLDMLLTGVGKTNAAAATILAARAGAYRAFINLGVCGVYPETGLRPGALVVGERSALADEGVATPRGFESIADLGFPPWLGDATGDETDAMSAPADARLCASLTPLADGVGVLATVSTCSGTDALSAQVRARTDAIGEGMEGAAIGLTLANLAAAGGLDDAIAFIEVRTASNTTGDRLRQSWDLPGALARLSDLAERL